MPIGVFRALGSPLAWRQVSLAALGVPLGLVGLVGLSLVVVPPVALVLGDVRIETRSGPLDPTSPALLAVWCGAVLLGLGLSLGTVTVDRMIVVRLVPRPLAAGWPRLRWRWLFGTDAVWRGLAWLLLRIGFAVALALWAWLVLSTAVNLARASLPVAPGTLWRPLATVALVLGRPRHPAWGSWPTWSAPRARRGCRWSCTSTGRWGRCRRPWARWRTGWSRRD